MGWTGRSMLDLYAEDMQLQRAIAANAAAATSTDRTGESAMTITAPAVMSGSQQPRFERRSHHPNSGHRRAPWSQSSGRAKCRRLTLPTADAADYEDSDGATAWARRMRMSRSSRTARGGDPERGRWMTNWTLA